jgi:hypothetical protein
LPPLLAAVAAIALGSGCTSGVIVDTKFNMVAVNGAVVTFDQLDGNLKEQSPPVTYTTQLGNTAFVSFDGYAPDGATAAPFRGVSNSRQSIAPGNYRVIYVGNKLYVSNPFVHNYDGDCTDGLTGGSDKLCETYYFQIQDDIAHCNFCPINGNCSLQDLPTQNGLKIIPLCPATG